MGHKQTAQADLHCLLIESLISIWKNEKIPPQTHGRVLLIRVGKSFGLNGFNRDEKWDVMLT